MTAVIRTVDDLIGALGIPFSEEQVAAITAPLEPAVIIAGAGTGKTTVMAARVVWLVGTGQVDAAEVLGLTFTRKAAGELDGRIRRALASAGTVGDQDQNPLVATYDSFAARLVDDFGLLLGIEPGMRLLNNASRFRLASTVVARAGEELTALASFTAATVTNRVLSLSAELRSHLVEPERLLGHGRDFLAMLDAAERNRRGEEYAQVTAARATLEQRRELVRLVVDYERLKAEHECVEFADILASAARLAAEVPEVSTQVRGDYSVVLLDEYQDTSAAQAVLLRGLFSGASPATGQGHPVTAVGDPGQAIYGWRGAASSNILQFSHDFLRADGSASESYPLTINRRSGPEILAAANKVAEQLRDEPMVTALGLDLRLVAGSAAAPARVDTASFDTAQQELAWLVGQIAAAHDSGRAACYAEIAVLCRTNSQVAAVAGALEAAEIPAEVVGLGGLLELPFVAQVVSTLAVLADPNANADLLRLLTSPRWAIGVPDLEQLGRRARHLATESNEGPSTGQETVSLLEALLNPGPADYSVYARSRFAALAGELAAVRRYLNGGVNELVLRVMEGLGVFAEAEVARPGSMVILQRFVAAVADYIDFDPQATLAGLLAYLDAERSESIGLEQPAIADTDSVKVLTVHKAKGLEWDMVFVPALRVNGFPLTRVRDNWVQGAQTLPYPLRGDVNALPVLPAANNSDLDAFQDALRRQLRLSEDRLAYVAITRARRHLLASTSAWGASNTQPYAPSDYFCLLTEGAEVAGEPELTSETNPNLDAECSLSWPVLDDDVRGELRRVAAARVRQIVADPTGGESESEIAELDLDGRERVEGWRTLTERLVAIEKADRLRRHLPEPDYLSVTGLAQLNKDPEAFARNFRRPMPHLASDAQRIGTDFHRWLEERFQQQTPLVDDPDFAGPTELVGEEFAKLRAGFDAGPFADVQPVGVEVPFTVVLAGQLVRGRIDAVFTSAEGRYQVVDWKTGSTAKADPLQLACYRLAWSELTGVSPESVDAMFFDLHSGRCVVHDRLPGRAEIEEIVTRRLDTLPK